MELSKLEKQIIESFRNGGKIDIWHFDVPTYQEAVDYIQVFGKITRATEHDTCVIFKYMEDGISVYSSVNKDTGSE